MCKLGVEEWAIRIIKAMYDKAKYKVSVSCLNSSYESTRICSAIHKESILFIMEVFLENRKSAACNIYKSYKTCLDDFLNKIKNASKLKPCTHSTVHRPVTHLSKWLWGVCSEEFCNNSICLTCKCWIHKHCSETRGYLSSINGFKCRKYRKAKIATSCKATKLLR